MLPFVARRLLEAVFVLLAVTVIGFGVTRLMGDPLAAYYASPYVSPKDLEAMRAHYGLDRPVPVQYLYWLRSIATGDWGTSILGQQKVAELFLQRLPNTLILGGAAYVFILLAGVGLGIFTALRRGTWLDTAITSVAVVGYSVPVFWLGLMLITLFGVKFKEWGWPYLPVGGMYRIEEGRTISQVLWHLILPAATLTVVVCARYVRFVRASMLEVLQRDYVRTAYAKGLSSRRVHGRHALRNAMLPLVTLAALDLPVLLAGSVITETVYSWPGLGRLFWDAAQQVDYPIMMAILVFSAAVVVASNLLADVAYAYLDPRIRYA
jgi:peptide/nickel transport system permease protein